jgi:hypothetical protein
VDGQLAAMKFVVTGAEECARIASRSAMKQARRAASENRAKSSCCAGLTDVAAAAGTCTCSQSA